MSLRLIEVGPRDGLQNEKTPVPTEAKLAFIERLAATGLREIEATSFVSPKWVPQLGDAESLWPQLPMGPLYSALIPNLKGLERATGVERIALFTAASDAFTQKNIGMTVAESLDAFRQVAERFREAQPNGWIRAYVSTAFACPYAGTILPHQVVKVLEQLLEIGADEISFGDTIGVASPREVRDLLRALESVCPSTKLAAHFHDTNGTAIANIATSYEHGIRAFDSSAAGLGGCPYAPGAGGNVATEDVVYFFEREGVPTGVDLTALAQASLPILELLGRPVTSKAQLARLARCAQP